MKMRYMVTNRTNIDRIDDLLEVLLEMRGVENPQGFLHLTPSVLKDPMSFRNMGEAVEMLHKHMMNNSNIHIIMDSDNDGLTSATATYGYIQRYSGIECTYDAHEAKQHGLYREVVERIPWETNLLIIPDASSDSKSLRCIKELVEEGLDVLVLDHHEISDDWEAINGVYEDKGKAILVNNQDGSYGNTTLSGVGVVFKLLMAMDELHPSNNVDAMEFLGLTALGMVSDLMDCRNHETRFLINSGLKYVAQDSELLKAIVDRNSYAIKDNVTISALGWKISPILNACFRQGNRDDKLLMLEAMIGVGMDRTFMHTPSRATLDNPNKEPIEENFVAHVLRRLETLKREQDKQKKESSQALIDEIENSELKDSKIIIIDTKGLINPTHSGLTANELAKKYQRPVLLLTDNGSDYYGGSGRNYDKFEISNLNAFVESSGLAQANGHEQAFGIMLKKDDLEEFKAYCNEQLKDVDIRPITHVDFEIPIQRLKERHINKVGEWQDMWGGKGMESPLFAIVGIQIDSVEIKKIKNLMKFEVKQGGETITFVRPRTSEDFYNELIHEPTGRNVGRSGQSGNKKLDITVIGKFTINEYNNRQQPQIEIVEIDSKISEGTRRRRL